MRSIRAVLLACAMLFLAGCAHPDLIKLGTSYEEVIADLGTPNSRSLTPEGEVRIVYSAQPMGQQSYVMIFDKQGKLKFKDNLLQQKYFDQVQPKNQTEQDIYVMFGEPCEKWEYRLSGEKSYMYRFTDGGQDWAFWVDFDLKTGEVLRYEISIDPWTLKGGDDDIKI